MDKDAFEVHTRDEGAARSDPALLASAADQLNHIFGPDKPTADELLVPHTGPCHICGSTRKLTYEHLPPRSAGNSVSRRMASFRVAREAPLGEFPKRGWHQQQRGAGLYVTCAECNNFSGREHVKGYSDFSRVIGDSVLEVIQDAHPGPRPEGLRVELTDVATGQVVRQALAMLLATSGSAGLSSRYSEIGRCIKGEQLALPDDLHVGFLAIGQNTIRWSGASVVVNFAESRFQVVVELAHFPLAWLLEVGPRETRGLIDVTDWTQHSLQTKSNMIVEVPIKAIVTTTPGDYRSIDEVRSDADL